MDKPDHSTYFRQTQQERDAERIRHLIAAANNARYLALHGVDTEANAQFADDCMDELRLMGVGYGTN